MSRSQRVLRWFAVTVLSGLLLAGCGADDGEQGAVGPAGPPGPPGPVGTGNVRTVASAEVLNATIDDVSIPDSTGQPVVNFSLSDEDGIAVVGISNVRFSMAKLIPADIETGDSSAWQSYVNRTETSGSTTTSQATNERGGDLVDNNDGTYTYTFSNNVTNVTSPVAVTYDPTATHRVAMQINADDNLPTANAVYTWQPSTGLTSGIDARDIVVTESCNECHGTLALHGGGRIDTKYCVTCHNPGSVDAQSGETVDFKVMIHKIHRGANLPSVADGGETYSIFGFRDREHDYSEVHFPQDIRGCAKCHDETDTTNTPQAVNWQEQPTMEACGSCHDDVDFSAETDPDDAGYRTTHTGGVQVSNRNCASCHEPTGTQGITTSVAEAHRIPAREASAALGFEILSITSASGEVGKVPPDEAPIVTFRAINPQDDSNYDLATTDKWSSITLRAAWSTTDYQNIGTVEDHFGPQDISFGGRSSLSLADIPRNPDDGTYTVTFGDVIPATATGSGGISIEGQGSGGVPVKAEVAYFAITDASAVARRDIVDIDNCDKCHEQLALHGNNRTDEPQLCVVCHTSNRTDIGRRAALTDLPETPDVDESVPIDGKTDESIDFKHMIHAIHASSFREEGVVIYGFTRDDPVGAGNPFKAEEEVHFPGILSNCRTCHLDGTYELPLDSGVAATTVSTGADPNSLADDQKITPTASVCSSCHDSELARGHMEQNGARFDASPADLVNLVPAERETCAVCHGPDSLADVEVVHGIN